MDSCPIFYHVNESIPLSEKKINLNLSSSKLLILRKKTQKSLKEYMKKGFGIPLHFLFVSNWAYALVSTFMSLLVKESFVL